MSENPWFLINRGTQAKGWRGSGKWNQERDTISHFCGPLSYFRICCNESLRHSTDTFKWWRKFIVQWRASDKNLSLPPPPSLSEAYDQKRKPRQHNRCAVCKPGEICKWTKYGRIFVLIPPSLPLKNVYEAGGGTLHPLKEACHRKGLHKVSYWEKRKVSPCLQLRNAYSCEILTREGRGVRGRSSNI